MTLKILFKNARFAAVELEDGGVYDMEKTWKIFVNGKLYKETSRVINMIYGLEPETEYEIRADHGDETACVTCKTDYEYVTMNVRDFGAKGDGVSDDTHFIQAAVMACPRESRVLIPSGVYRISTLFLKDHLNLELEKGAVLKAFTEREKFPVFQGTIPGNRSEEEMLLGTWEGDSQAMFSGIICGVRVNDVTIYGEGVVDGNASHKNWWENPKDIKIAARPRMIFLNQCENIVVAGITVQNSPSWNVHPYFSRHLQFIGMQILGPKDSPNTDGLDPESCKDVRITGVYFSVGDDCIAVKSGKIAVGSKYKTPSEDIIIRQCCMRDGNGSITLGSEMAAGVKNLKAMNCKFLNTDRGLRIKTRRGRGKDAVIDNILFEDIVMDHVMTPFVINCFYFCDPDGKTDYVQCKKALPVDERTPAVKKLTFKNIKADNCHVAAAFFYGLPEQKIEEINMEHVRVTYAKEAKAGKPAMMNGVSDEIKKMGIYANNIKKLTLCDVNIQGADSEAIHTENVDKVVR